ncbi:unnamed protein product [Bemisia tabaci]|uniref:Secreted protein n=1 Tax=Bemisia tabaci TaxID=7038 RepID=A0A9P0A0K9_BEMTA|nr:unnamed protein product [Bemisia tabaci]
MVTKWILLPLFLVTIVNDPVAVCVKKTPRERTARHFGLQFLSRSSKSGRSLSRSRARQLSPSSSWSFPSVGDFPTSPELQRIADEFVKFNRKEASHIKNNLSTLDLLGIREYMTSVATNDQCSNKFDFRHQGSKTDCVAAFKRFKSIPYHLRGAACADAYLAWCCRLAVGNSKTCAFFVKTSPGETRPVKRLKTGQEFVKDEEHGNRPSTATDICHVEEVRAKVLENGRSELVEQTTGEKALMKPLQWAIRPLCKRGRGESEWGTRNGRDNWITTHADLRPCCRGNAAPPQSSTDRKK